MSGKCYIETFEEDAGGWYGWNADGAAALEIRDGAAITHSPWWVDYNHAPPGAGYLHILFALDMHEKGARQGVEGENRFTRGKHPTDFTDASLTFRIRGDLEQPVEKPMLCRMNRAFGRVGRQSVLSTHLRVRVRKAPWPLAKRSKAGLSTFPMAPRATNRLWRPLGVPMPVIFRITSPRLKAPP